MKNFALARTLASGLVALLPSLALAQPADDQAPVAQNPPNQNPGGRGGRGGGNLTDAQRQQLEAQNQMMREIQQRQSLIYAGITEVATQDAILAFLKEQETARQSLRDKWNALSQALRGDTTDQQLAILLNNFRNAADDERVRREVARAALDAKIGLTQNPRLDAQLMTSGILGDESTLMNAGGARGTMGGFGGLFGPGGFGGNFGGPGGFGG